MFFKSINTLCPFVRFVYNLLMLAYGRMSQCLIFKYFIDIL
jgi:hypothetical protein